MAAVPTPTADFHNHVRDTLDRLGRNAWRYENVTIGPTVVVRFLKTNHVVEIYRGGAHWYASCDDMQVRTWLTGLLRGETRDDSGKLAVRA